MCGDSIDGRGPEELAKIRRENIGFVFQSYHLFPTLTAAENVRLALDVRDERGPQGEAKAEDVLARVGLAPKTIIFPAPAQRRRAAARRDRACHRRRSVGRSCRRAHRGARLRERQGDHGYPGRDRERPGSRRSGRDPRSAAVRFADRIVHIEDGLLTREEPCNPDPANAAARGRSTRLLSPDLRKIKPQQAACRNIGDHPFAGVSHE